MADRAAIDAFWLPRTAPAPSAVDGVRFGPGGVPLRVPRLEPDELRAMMVGLRQTRARELAGRRTVEVVEVVAAAAARLVDPERAFRRDLVETLPGLTGYSDRMIDAGLRRMAEGWTREALVGAIEDEFGSLSVLDEFRPREAGGRTRAYGPRLTVHVFSGNIPGISVTSLIRALCVKSASLGKTAAGEPYFAVCFARALAEVDPELADCLAVVYWPGGSTGLEETAFAEADAVVAYGADATIADVRDRLPVGTRFVGYPNRVGAAIVTRGALGARGPTIARAAASDVVAFDQQGCVSPHVIFVEEGGTPSPEEFGATVAGEMERLAAEVPRGPIAPDASSRIHQLRAQAEVRGATVHASPEGTGWTVIVEARAEFEPSPLNRVVHVRAVPSADDAVAALARVGDRLQTVALAAGAEEVGALADRLGAAGATRIVPLGEAAWPAPHWHHDGRFQFLDLVRFVDLEFG